MNTTFLQFSYKSVDDRNHLHVKTWQRNQTNQEAEQMPKIAN